MPFPQRKPGSTPAARPARKPLPSWKVPQDFKPHFILVQFVTDKDGLPGTRFKATRYVGRFSEDVDDKKKFDIMSYDPKTVMAMHGRMSSVLYKATNDKKFDVSPKVRATERGAMRLPAKAMFSVLVRVGKKSADDTLTARVSQVWQTLPLPKTGKMKKFLLEKTDPAYRMIRRSSRILPAAFAETLMPPKRTRRTAQEDEE